ncbi:uncharacterized protein LOC123005511 [Tribolium madens]|uniref:uncharacterized protein LOC123005511 n=1 Tax=Tribolium madens TaxID=41895 RepID=UPI001CF75539|nr:uncharacterized protein LOC123005511 [Tribolium madens]
MFSRAQRFDYYPKPERTTPQSCDRCTKHTHDFVRSSTKRRILNKSLDSSYQKTPKNLFGKNDLKKSTEGVQKLNSTEEISVKKETKVQVHRSSQSSSEELQLSRGWTPEDHYDNVYDTCGPSEDKNNLLEYLTTMERKIDNQRQKVEELRRQLTASADEGFNSSRSPTPPNASIQDRISNLEDISRSCVKETLDYITMSNKEQESKCRVRPKDHEELVEFCTEVITEVAEKLTNKKREKKTWKKIKAFFVDFIFN